jgi:hypothetical protein
MAARWTRNLALTSPIHRSENGKLRFQVPKIFSIWRGSRAFRDKFLREAIKKEFVESPATEARMGRGGLLRSSSFSADSQRWPLRKSLRFHPWL